jgi:formylglycine-generating enzyme required for sulfatase activity
MATRKLLALVALAGLASTATGTSPAEADAPRTASVVIPTGTYRPLFPVPPNETTVDVPAFRLDKTPVTNREFLAFVRMHPEWRRDRVEPVFAEKTYLANWQTADGLGAGLEPNGPVVDVSWFAARAYCAAQGKRLPREAEWERAAAASRTAADGALDETWRAEIVAAYSRPSPARFPPVGTQRVNFFGVQDLHGLVWEWVFDFANATSAFAAGSDRLRFCGATASSATSATDFAAFQRAALRTSLRANYTLRNLGFRCAADLEPGGSS